MASSSCKSSGLTYDGGANSCKVSGSTNLTYILFLSLSTFPSLSFLGVNPKPLILILVPPIEGPDLGVYDATNGSV